MSLQRFTSLEGPPTVERVSDAKSHAEIFQKPVIVIKIDRTRTSLLIVSLSAFSQSTSLKI